MRRPMHATAAFTLVEMLIALAVGAVVSLLIMQFFGSTAPIATDSMSSSRTYRELQNTAAVIGDDVRQASLIYPAGTAVSINAGIAAGAPSVAGSSLIALQIPVRAPSTCPATGREFIAYYVAPRSSYVGGSEWTDPGVDTENASSSVLMQYRACASAPTTTATLTNPFVRMVADHIDLAQFSLGTSPSGLPGAVTVDLRTKRVSRGRPLYTPSQTGTLTLTAYARNIN